MEKKNFENSSAYAWLADENELVRLKLVLENSLDQSHIISILIAYLKNFPISQ